jgi:hypothetical protein
MMIAFFAIGTRVSLELAVARYSEIATRGNEFRAHSSDVFHARHPVLRLDPKSRILFQG